MSQISVIDSDPIHVYKLVEMINYLIRNNVYSKLDINIRDYNEQDLINSLTKLFTLIEIKKTIKDDFFHIFKLHQKTTNL